MAVCEIWDVRGRLDSPLRYAANPDKTRNTLNKGEAVDSAPRGHSIERCENRLIQRFPNHYPQLKGKSKKHKKQIKSRTKYHLTK